MRTNVRGDTVGLAHKRSEGGVGNAARGKPYTSNAEPGRPKDLIGSLGPDSMQSRAGGENPTRAKPYAKIAEDKCAEPLRGSEKPKLMESKTNGDTPGLDMP